MSSINSTSDKEDLKGPKPEDLDVIANVMDNILINMKSHVQNIKKNKINDNSSTGSAFPNLTGETQQEIISDIQNMKSHMENIKNNKINEISMSSASPNVTSETQQEMMSDIEAPNKNMKPPPISENDEANSKDQKNVDSTKKLAHSAVQNTQKKTVSYKKNESTKSNICNDVQNKKRIQNNSEKPAPKKNKENDKFISKSLSKITKQNNAPKILTVPIVNNKSDNRRNAKSRCPSITDNINIITRNTRTKSLSAKTGNIIHNPPQQTRLNSLQTKSFASNISSKTPKTYRPNKINILREKNNKKHIEKPSLYVTPKECMEKQIHRNSNLLRPINQCETPCSRNTANQKRTASLNTKSTTGTHNKNIQNQNVNNKRPTQETSKSQNEVRKSQNTNTDIRSAFQNEKKLNDDKENQIPGPSTSQPNRSVSLNTNPTNKISPLNQSNIASTSSNLNQTAPSKFIKNNAENPKIQKENDKESATTETEIKEPKQENEIKEPKQENEIKEPKKENEIKEPKKENEIKEPKQENEIKEPKKENEIKEPKKEDEIKEPKKENEIKEPKKEDEIKDDTQSNDESKLNEMGDCTVKLINEKIQDIIDKIKEEKDTSKLNLCKTSCTNAANISQKTEKKENKPVIKKPPTPISKPIPASNNTKVQKFNSKRNVKPEQQANTKKAITNNNQKNSTSVKPSAIIANQKISNSVKPSAIIANQKISTSVKPSAIIATGVSKPSAQSCAVPKSNNMLCVRPSRKLSMLTPMEIVQDFVNLVNRAKRDRKTYTVCGNYFSVRRAFAERGWIEKLRINLTDDKDSWRKLDTLTNFELVEGIKDKENGEKYRRVFISKLLAGHQVDFYWDYMTNPFNVNNDKIKRTIINRFPFGSTRSYTSKAGLCESLKDAHWYYVEGQSNILFPRTYNLAYEEEISSFVEDFRLTAVISLLNWILKYYDKPACIISPSGQIPTSVFNFATMQCYNYIKIKEHKDLDDIIPQTREYEWDIFLEKFYKIVHQGAHFKANENMTAPLIIDQARYILNKMQKYSPGIEKEGIMNLWLLKPNNGSRGCGIHVCRTLKYTLDMVSTRKETKYVIQKYIERPLLIHNTKFDIRQWFLVTCMPNLQIWLYKDCYLRFSSQMYDLSKLHESIHLTNNSIQCRYKNNANRNAALPDQNMWHSDTFRKYLTEIGQPYAWKNIIYKGIKECLVGLFMLCQDRLLTRVNSFELCGADFMLTEDFRPYLIEINSRPALYPSTKITAMMCPKVLEDVVRVTVDYARNPRAGTGNFELIYKDTYSYVPPKNVSNLFIDGISYVKYATDSTLRNVISPFEKNPIHSLEQNTGSIQKLLKIDPTKVRKDVKNTLEKILAIIHTEQSKSDDKDTSDEKSKQFQMMLSEFVDIISCVENKQKATTP